MYTTLQHRAASGRIRITDLPIIVLSLRDGGLVCLEAFQQSRSDIEMSRKRRAVEDNEGALVLYNCGPVRMYFRLGKR